MVIIHLTDIHGHTDRIEPVLQHAGKADIILLTGDLTHFGGKEEAEPVIEIVRQFPGRILALPGNCDHPSVQAYLEKEGVSLHRRAEVINGLGFAGMGLSLRCPGKTPGEITEEELKEGLAEAHAQLPDKAPWILLTHEPPYGTCNDRVFFGKHVGSRSIRNFIEKHEPLVCFTGHIHEGTGIDTIGITSIVNPGPLKTGHYGYAEIDKGVVKVEIRQA